MGEQGGSDVGSASVGPLGAAGGASVVSRGATGGAAVEGPPSGPKPGGFGAVY